VVGAAEFVVLAEETGLIRVGQQVKRPAGGEDSGARTGRPHEREPPASQFSQPDLIPKVLNSTGWTPTGCSWRSPSGS